MAQRIARKIQKWDLNDRNPIFVYGVWVCVSAVKPVCWQRSRYPVNMLCRLLPDDGIWMSFCTATETTVFLFYVRKFFANIYPIRIKKKTFFSSVAIQWSTFTNRQKLYACINSYRISNFPTPRRNQ